GARHAYAWEFRGMQAPGQTAIPSKRCAALALPRIAHGRNSRDVSTFMFRVARRCRGIGGNAAHPWILRGTPAGPAPERQGGNMRAFKITTAACALAALAASTAWAQEVDWKKVDEAFGRSGAVAGDVHRYGFPRTDLQVTLDGVTIKPAFALGGWIALKPAHGGAMAMGDLVLLESEVNPVMAKLIEGGLDITAVHNHLLRASPATFYMHVGGHGDPVKLATAIHDALAASKTPLAPPTPPATQPAIDLNTAQLDEIIGAKGNPVGGVYQFAVPRREAISEGGAVLAPPG